MRLIKSAMNKVCSNIEQKGVAQLLQIEDIDNRVNERDRKQPFPAGNASYQYRISAFIRNI